MNTAPFHRSTRYVVRATFKGGRTDDCLQVNSSRTAACRRASVIAQTWPGVTRVWVVDTYPTAGSPEIFSVTPINA